MKKMMNRVFSMLFLVEVVLVIFAIASVSTISDYLVHTHTNVITSYAIGSGMGFGLVILSILLSRIDTKSPTFIVLLTTTLGVAALSGTLQTLAYNVVTQDLLTSFVKGVGFPLVEVALAYSVSRYSSYMKVKEIEDADAEFEQSLARTEREGMRQLSSEKMQAKMQDGLDRILDARLNHFVDKQLAKYTISDITVKIERHANDSTTATQERHGTIATLPIIATQVTETHDTSQDIEEDTDTDISDTDMTPSSLVQTDGSDTSVTDTNVTTDTTEATRQSKATGDTLVRLATLLAEDYDGHVVDDIDKTLLATRLGTTVRTVQRNVNKLRDTGKLNGHVAKEILLG